jgi:Domain of unknown function (DUF4279)
MKFLKRLITVSIPLNKKTTLKPPPPSYEDIPKSRLVTIGGHIDEVKVHLRIFGERLDPDEITGLLGCQPTSSLRKGDVIPDKRYHRIASRGSWLLDGQLDRSVELEQQVKSLLEMVTDDIRIWRDLASRFQLDILFIVAYFSTI